MDNDRLARKLTGYSRLTGEDEEGTHRRLSTYLDRFASTITEHRGRVVVSSAWVGEGPAWCSQQVAEWELSERVAGQPQSLQQRGEAAAAGGQVPGSNGFDWLHTNRPPYRIGRSGKRDDEPDHRYPEEETPLEVGKPHR